MSPIAHVGATRPAQGAVLTKAVVRAADRLKVSSKVVARTLGLSEPTVSRMRRGSFTLDPTSKPFELGVLLVRLFRSLDAIVGGDESAAAAWLANTNTVLDGRPIDKIQKVDGLTDVIAYLDARRARV